MDIILFEAPYGEVIGETEFPSLAAAQEAIRALSGDQYKNITLEIMPNGQVVDDSFEDVGYEAGSAAAGDGSTSFSNM